MISKECFVKIVDSLRDYSRELDKLMDALDTVFEDNFLVKYMDDIMDALSVECGDTFDGEPWLWYYAYGLDWGEADGSVAAVMIDNEPRPLTDAGQLYDILMELKDRNE